ncbi:alpha-L-iduronidase-like [Styela clava]
MLNLYKYLPILVFSCAFCFHSVSCQPSPPHIFNITVDASNLINVFDHFWESTGMCPPLPHQNASDYYLSQDMLQNLIHIGSVPHSGIKQVRMHWLLDMVTYDKEKHTYNFTNLDTLFKFMRKYNLNPGFELMGSPSNKFTNFDDHDQIIDWMNLVTQLGKRYIQMFGLDVVSKWNFETWNEPDHKDFDNVIMSVEGFLKYYDACSEGLNAADSLLRFGGPGGSCRKESFSKRCWALLEHCTEGTNYITGSKGSRLDYISMHKKGGGRSSYIIESELETISKIHSLYPSLITTQIYNDEADPMVGWSRPYSWRADATYAAIVAKIIAQHQYRIITNESSHIIYSLLSNDNGFLNYSPYYFTQRTLTARFQMNNTSPPHVHFVKKPIYASMMLLSKLGHMLLGSKIVRLYNNTPDDRIGVIATVCQAGTFGCSNQEITLLTYCSDDTNPSKDTVDVFINFVNLTPIEANTYIMTCRVDESTNPWQVWKNAGSPDFPSRKVFANMHHASEPNCDGAYQVPITPDPRKIGVEMQLMLPGVYLHQICRMPPDEPKAPILLSVTNVTSAQVLIAWNDSPQTTKCIKTYFIVLCADASCKSLQEVNPNRVLSNSFVYMSPTEKDKDVYGYYKVAVVDFWSRYSTFSNTIAYP